MVNSLLHNEASFFAVLLFAFSLYVLTRGQAAEKIAAAICIVASIATPMASHQVAWMQAEVGILVVDIFAMAGFGAVMAYSRKFWPMWVTALQIVTVAFHVAQLAHRSTVPLAYAVATTLCGYIVLSVIAGAAYLGAGRPAPSSY